MLGAGLAQTSVAWGSLPLANPDVARGVTYYGYSTAAGGPLTQDAHEAAKTEPAFEPKLRRLAVLAAQVRADLNRLGGASKEEERAIGRELQAAAQESQKISEELK